MDRRIKRLGRATWQRDWFGVLYAEDEGIVVTKALFLPVGTAGLEVNVNATGGPDRGRAVQRRRTRFGRFIQSGVRPVTARRSALAGHMEGWRTCHRPRRGQDSLFLEPECANYFYGP